MKLRFLNKKIKAREQYYHDSADRINKRFGEEIKKLDNFRMFCIFEVWKLKDKDRTLIKYNKLKRKLKGLDAVDKENEK